LTEPSKIKDLENELEILTQLTQAILDIEWKWIKAESKYGELNKKQKEEILIKYEKLRK
jgi:hypothetical protein